MQLQFYESPKGFLKFHPVCRKGSAVMVASNWSRREVMQAMNHDSWRQTFDIWVLEKYTFGILFGPIGSFLPEHGVNAPGRRSDRWPGLRCPSGCRKLTMKIYGATCQLVKLWCRLVYRWVCKTDEFVFIDLILSCFIHGAWSCSVISESTAQNCTVLSWCQNKICPG